MVPVAILLIILVLFILVLGYCYRHMWFWDWLGHGPWAANASEFCVGKYQLVTTLSDGQAKIWRLPITDGGLVRTVLLYIMGIQACAHHCVQYEFAAHLAASGFDVYVLDYNMTCPGVETWYENVKEAICYLQPDRIMARSLGCSFLLRYLLCCGSGGQRKEIKVGLLTPVPSFESVLPSVVAQEWCADPYRLLEGVQTQIRMYYYAEDALYFPSHVCGISYCCLPPPPTCSAGSSPWSIHCDGPKRHAQVIASDFARF